MPASSVGVVYTSTLPLYAPYNSSVSFTVTASAAITTSNLKVWVSVLDATAIAYCSAIDLNSTVVNGTTSQSFSFKLNTTTLAGALANANCNLLADTTGLVATANFTATNQSSTEISTNVLGLEPTTIALVSPGTSTSLGLGNVTFLVAASGQFITGVVVTVVLNGTVVFNQTLLGLVNTTDLYGPSVWTAASAGAYAVSITLTTSYGAVYQNSTLTVTTPGTTTVTSSSWSNTTLIPGLSGAVGGTLLLVVGMIVGMISAWAVSRWTAAPKPAAPQAWSGGAQGAAKGANTCSTCGASFATAEELQAHAKSEHGMG